MRGWARVGNVHGPHGFVDLDSFMGLGRSRYRGGSSERERRSDDCRGDQSFHGTSSSLVKAEKTPERHQG
jgi:hypothetical protein